ncbi:MAG: hypothetical protein AAB955_01320 [Patescibacteria group bacterium]
MDPETAQRSATMEMLPKVMVAYILAQIFVISLPSLVEMFGLEEQAHGMALRLGYDGSQVTSYEKVPTLMERVNDVKSGGYSSTTKLAWLGFLGGGLLLFVGRRIMAGNRN